MRVSPKTIEPEVRYFRTNISGLSRIARFPTAGQGERGLWVQDRLTIKKCTCALTRCTYPERDDSPIQRIMCTAINTR